MRSSPRLIFCLYSYWTGTAGEAALEASEISGTDGPLPVCLIALMGQMAWIEMARMRIVRTVPRIRRREAKSVAKYQKKRIRVRKPARKVRVGLMD